MKQGGLIIFDTKNDGAFGGSLTGGTSTPLGQLLGKLDLPPLQRVPEGHVLTKAFYLLHLSPAAGTMATLGWRRRRKRRIRPSAASSRTASAQSL